MSAPYATCELYVDGTRVADTGSQLNSGRATALTDLKIDWGRDGQNEQPGPASCSFDILDPTGRDDALDLLHVGSKIEVWADGAFSNPDAWGSTSFDNGHFIGWPDGPVPQYTIHVNTTLPDPARVINETIGVQWDETQPGFSTYAFVPPRSFSPPGQLPDAWDDIPRMSQGETWKISVRVKVPAGVKFIVPLYGVTSPYTTGGALSYTYSPPAQTLVGTGDWQLVEGVYTLTAVNAPMWVCIRVTMVDNPVLGRCWQDQTGIWSAQSRSWADAYWLTEVFIDDCAAYPPGETHRRVLAFSGSVSDVTIAPADDGHATLISSTAMNLAAELGNRVIGDDPWQVETVTARGTKIVHLAGIFTAPPLRIDPPLDALQVSYRDVDAQPAFELLQDLAQTAGGVLWVATHAVTGEFIWIEDPAGRQASKQFSFTAGGASTLSSTNLAENPGMEGGSLTGWLSAQGSSYFVALDSTSAMSGTYSCLATRQGTITSAVAAISLYRTGTTRFAVTPGVPFTFSLDVKTELGARKIYMSIGVYDSTGTLLGTDGGAYVLNSTTAGQTYRVSNTITPRAGAATAYLSVQVYTVSGNATLGERVWFDRLRVGGSPTDTAYFDGDTPATGDYTYNWTGTSKASTSQRWLKGHGTISIVGADTNLLSACDLLEEPVRWRQDTADVITIVAVTWLEQGVDEELRVTTTERTVTVKDDAAITTYGTRRLSVSTELISQADATAMANRILAQARKVSWRLDGLTLDTAVVEDELDSLDHNSRVATLLDLLDGTVRMGLALTLIDMPTYSPAGEVFSAYVDGGSYEFDQGFWRLSLTTTPSAAQGSSATWGELDPAWKWIEWNPSIQWIDTYGVDVTEGI